MSTRCNIIIKDEYGDELIFYRHSDGYPEGVEPTLRKFMEYIRGGKIRRNTMQAAGWLILIGHNEYRGYEPKASCGSVAEHDGKEPVKSYESSAWKCGAYEPTTGIHGDIEYLYEISLSSSTVKGWEHNGKEKGKEVFAIAV